MSEAPNAAVPDSGPVIAFLPCRKGSERVKRKNIRPFGPFPQGLVQIKLGQLLACPAIARIVLSTDDDEILDLAAGLGAGPRLVAHRRAAALASGETSTDQLVGHAHGLIAPLAGDGHILWTHVTSPFVTARDYGAIIAAYRQALAAGHDSLMTTTPLHTFLWTEAGPLNYDRTAEKWPRTQTLAPAHEVNSAVFLAPVRVYAERGDRIGARPRLHPLDRLIALDIDWEADFVIAEQLLLRGLVTT